jgi:hypothetical protein
MVGSACQQLKRVRQKMQDCVEAVLSSRGTPRKIDDESATRDAADAAAESREGCLFDTAEAYLLGDAWNQAVTDGECGFGRNIALREACTTGGQDEIGPFCGIAQRGGELIAVVGDHLRINDLCAIFAQQPDEEWARDVGLGSGGTTIARGNHDGGSTRQRESCLLHLPRIADVRPNAPGCSAIRQGHTTER